MAKKKAGKVMILPRGDWNASVAYTMLDLVHVPNSATYLAIKDVPAGTAVTNTTYWQEICNTTGIHGDIANTYSSSATYDVGDYVMYDGILYICTTAITSGEAWNSAHWKRAVLADDVSDLKSAIVNVCPKVKISDVSMASFNDGANNWPLISLEANSQAKKVSFNGKNLIALPFLITNASLPTFSETFPIKAGTYRLHFDVSGATSWRQCFWMFTVEGVSVNGDTSFKPILNDYEGGTSWNAISKAWLQGANSQNHNSKIYFPKDCYIRFGLLLGNVTSSTTVDNAQLETGDVKTAFEPYKGQIYNADEENDYRTFFGINNIFADVGNISMEYSADIKLYIDGKIAELQATVLENIGG